MVEISGKANCSDALKKLEMRNRFHETEVKILYFAIVRNKRYKSSN